MVRVLFGGGLAKLDRDAMLTIVSRIVVMIAGIATGIVTARLLGVEGRGVYFYAVTMAGFVTQAGNLGFPSANTYIVAREPGALPGLMANSIWLSLASLLVGAPVLYAVAELTGRSPDLMVLAALLGSVNLLFMLFSNVLVGLQRIGRFNVFQIVSNLLTLAFILTAGWLAAGVAGFLSAGLLATAVATVLTMRDLGRGTKLKLRFDTGLFQRSIGYSLRAFVVTLLGFAVLRGNVLLLEHMAPTEELGYYSVAAQIADAVGVLPISFALVVFPRLVRQDTGRYHAMMRQARLMAGLMLVACLGAGVLVGPFVRIAFGEAFVPAIGVFWLMLPGVFCLGIGTMISQYLAAEGFPKKTVAVWGVSAIAVFAAAGVLVPDHGAAGAAISLSIGYVAFLLLMLVAARAQSRQGQWGETGS